MAEALWRLNGVSLGEGSSLRLREITLDIRPGVTAVLGCSGAGKSSLLNLLVGFERPTRGGLAPALPGGRLPLYWAPQNGGLWPHLTARRHVELARPEGEPAGRVEEMLEAFEIGAKAGSRPGELSQGERSRLALARGLMAGAAVLVIDEPLANVDATRAARLWRLIRDRVAAAGASLVYATHSPQMVIGEADRVVCLKEGRLLYEGEVETLYRRPPSREAAECLGEANWFEPGEARLWLGCEAAPRCLRPEQVGVRRAESGPLVVTGSRFKGAVAEVEVRHEASGAVRPFTHRPAGNGLRAGDRVIIKALLAVLVACLAGCGKGGEPALPVTASAVWPMPPERSMVPGPRGIATGLHDETLVLDTVGRVLVFGGDGRLQRQWTMPDYSVGRPEGIVMLLDGRTVVADTHYHRLVYFNADGTFQKSVGREGTGPGEFIYPVGITRDEQENLYVCEYGGNDRVQKFAREGEFLLQFGAFGTGEAEFQRPSGIAWHGGRVYIADAMNNRVLVYGDAGAFAGVLGAPGDLGLQFPYDVKAGRDGALYIIEYAAGRVSKVGRDGRLLGRYGRTGTGHGEFKTPWGIAVDSKLRVRVADTGNRRIVELTP